MKRCTALLILLVVILLKHSISELKTYEGKPHPKRCYRFRRQFDLSVTAEHDNQKENTDIGLEALATLWRSSDGKTTVDGGIKVLHSKSSFQTVNTKYKARLDVKFELGGK